MAIVKMEKITLLTFERYKDELFKKLQQAGNFHMRDLQQDEVYKLDFVDKPVSREKMAYLDEELGKVNYLIEKIEPFLEKKGMLENLMEPLKEISNEDFDVFLENYNYEDAYNLARKTDEENSRIASRISAMETENEEYKIWNNLDVSTKALDSLRTINYALGTINKNISNSFKDELEKKYSTVFVKFLGAVKEDIKTVLIYPKDLEKEVTDFCKEYGLSKVNPDFSDVPDALYKRNLTEIDNLKKEKEANEKNVSDSVDEHENLMIAKDCLSALLAREKSFENAIKTSEIIAIEGWAPSDEVEAVERIINNVTGEYNYMQKTSVEKESTDVPIKLKNNKVISCFESVTEMYSMPQYGEMDPTALLTPFYIVFFGIMVGDFGYGLIMLVATIIALKFFHFKDSTRTFIKFFFYLSFGVIGAGLIFGSFLGFSVFTPIQMADGTRKAILDTQNNDDIILMLGLSVVIGIVQLITGVLAKGYLLLRDGHILDAIFDSLLWIITILSGVGLIVTPVLGLPPIVLTVCGWAFGGSVVGLLLTQGRKSPSIGGKIGNGVFGVYDIVSYVGDMISYTRIAALALSGAYIAFSFNTMADLIPGSILKYVAGALVLALGHALNIGLSALSAYVHTCRLQFVEFFGKFYEGGGVPFAPLKIDNKYINIKK